MVDSAGDARLLMAKVQVRRGARHLGHAGQIATGVTGAVRAAGQSLHAGKAPGEIPVTLGIFESPGQEALAPGKCEQAAYKQLFAAQRPVRIGSRVIAHGEGHTHNRCPVRRQ